MDGLGGVQVPVGRSKQASLEIMACTLAQTRLCSCIVLGQRTDVHDA